MNSLILQGSPGLCALNGRDVPKLLQGKENLIYILNSSRKKSASEDYIKAYAQWFVSFK